LYYLRNLGSRKFVPQGLPGSLPWGVLLTFLNDFLYKDQHLSLAIATLVSPLSPSMPF